jgi:branched-chain amino acid aminotransferase
MATPYAYFQKQFMPLSEAKIGIVTHAFNYGTAVFEGVRGNWNPDERQLFLFKIAEHFERFQRSCKILRIDLPYTTQDYVDMILKLVELSGFEEDVYIRPLGYKSQEVVGVRLHDVTDDFLLFVVPLGNYIDSDAGIKCVTSSWRRPDDTMIPARAKITGIYVNSALAKTEAFEAGADEAIMLTAQGYVSEGSGENIFIVKNGALHTPGVSDNILEGITKETVSYLAKQELGMDTVARSIARSELYTADECFMTGTAAHVTPVLDIDHRKVGDGQIGTVTAKLQQLYFDAIRGKLPKYRHWTSPVYSKVRA